MSSAKVTWHGMKELRAALKTNAKLEDVKKVVKLNGSELQKKAQQAAPYDTGNLRRSIKLDVSDNGMTATVTAHAEYAPYVEYGTRYMDAQPYMTPSFEEQEKQFASDLKKLVKG